MSLMSTIIIGCISNFLIILTFITCKSDNRSSEQVETISQYISIDSILPEYDFYKPSKILTLGKKLKEISGLSFDDQSSTIFSVNDEQGILFQLELSNGNIIKSFDFAKKGDYEALAIKDSIVYIAKSNGHIYPFDLKNEKAMDKIKTPLSYANDVEGLCLSNNGKYLLVACKGNPGIEKKEKKQDRKAIFYFDLETNRLMDKNPQIIHEDTLLQWVFNNTKLSSLSYFNTKNLKNRVKKFSPSGIAQQPMSNDYYVLSYQGNLLVIFNSEWQIKHIEFLDDVHSQPEGICFGSQGQLYISNEANGLIPKIFMYTYRRTN